MPLNGIKAVGDDQQWKAEVEAENRRLWREIELLQQQVIALTQRSR